MTSRFHHRLRRSLLSLSLQAIACVGVGTALFLPPLLHAREAAAPAVAGAAATEHWLELRLAGVPAGYLLESADGDKTRIESKMVLNRLGSKVEIFAAATFDEDAQGRLRGVTSETSSSRERSTIAASVDGNALTLVTQAGGKSYTTKTPLTAPLYGPRGVRALVRAKLGKTGDVLEYSTFVPEVGAVAQVTRTVLRRETITVGARAVDAVVVNEVSSAMPIPTTLWFDADARVVRQEQRSPFGLVELSPGTAALRAVVDAGAELPEDTYSNAVARSNVRLPRPRDVERVVVRIDLKNPESGLPDLDGPNQRVLEKSDRHAVVEIVRPAEPAAAQSPRVDARYVEPDAILQADHADVRKLAAQLKRPGASRWQQARVLQDWVSDNMQFDAGVAMVSASEVVRDRRGTCVAYAVMLTSLARALEVPSRMVFGYVYAANMWGGHAWAEIQVGDDWVPLDAAMYAPGVADAARFAIVRLGADGGASAQAKVAQLFGNEKVRVVSYTIDGKKHDVAADAKPYAVDGDTYRNATLGFELRKPAGATFTQLDAMYPDTTIVAVRDVKGTETTVHQGAASVADLRDGGLAAYLKEKGYTASTPVTVASRAALVATKTDEGQSSTAIVFLDGEDVWQVRAKGDDSERRARETANGIALAAPGKALAAR
jgi:transglutaminase-like putative cysteine protease